MKGNLKQALENTNTMYSDLVEIANDITKHYVTEVNGLIENANKNIHNLSNEALQELMLNLSLKSFNLGDIKEKSALKAECAEALRKEAYAKEFNGAEGSVAAKENTATINISDEIMTETVYNLVASLLKTKLDEIHRVVDVIKTLLMTRMQEAKLSINNVGVGE